MKKLYTLIALLLTCNTLLAQHMSVESFSALESDMDARTYYPKLDLNGRKAALIKIESTYKGFAFDVGSLGIVDVDHSKTAETWVYVPSGVIRITIQHAELGTIRDYEFPISIREAVVYRMVLTADVVETVIHQRANGQYLALNITPADVNMTISVDNGAPTTIEDGEFNQWLTLGAHTYTISAPMYQDYTKSVTVADKRIEENIALQANFGTLSINSTPQATVTINNLTTETTPINRKLALGTYTIQLTAANYQPYTETVNLTKPLDVVTINKSLEPYFSQISLSVAMREATISINDEPRGTGSWSGTLMPATYIVKAEREGHRPTLYTLEVKSNTPQKISLDSPTPIYGSLNVSSNTNNAKLYVDGTLLGQTPNYFENILAGTHTLELRKDGYTSQTKTITVEEGRIAEVGFTLAKIQQATPTTVAATPVVTPSSTTATKNTTHTKLADYSATSYPTNTDTWTITSDLVALASFIGLRAALNAVEESGRKISLIFPNLRLVPLGKHTLAGAFYNCKALTSVELHVATVIGDEAFYSCDALTTVELPAATEIGNYAFYYCDALTKVELPAATVIGGYAFYDCDALTTVELPAATVIGDWAFYYCDALTTIELPVTTVIGSNAFRSCGALTSVELPVATEIGNYAFYSCNALNTMSLATDDGVVISSISNYAFSSTTTTNITLTLGSANSGYVSGNTLTVGTFSKTFKEIILQ